MAEVPPGLSIGEVAQRSGCRASALRYYEAEGLIASLPRSPTATRSYGPEVLDALEVITALRGAGFGISEIKAFMAIKKPGEQAELRLCRASQAIEDLLVTVACRRAALDKAEALLHDWQEDIRVYRET